MTSGEGASPVRIGNAERTAAMKALDEHLEAGRLTVEEYADRSAIAANAVVAADLAALFTDLPEPHPQLPGSPATPPPAGPPATPAHGEVAPRAQSAIEVWGPRLVAAAPIIAVALFLLTRQWVFFLLIPLAGAMFYGGRGRDHRRDRGRDRD